MTRISGSTVYRRWVFPILWYGALAYLLIRAWVQQAEYTSFLYPIGLGLLGYLSFRAITTGLVDEVWDGGDHVVIRNRGVELRVPLTEIVDIGQPRWDKGDWPPRFTMELLDPSPFGDTIAFVPLEAANPFREPTELYELMARVTAARDRQS